MVLQVIEVNIFSTYPQDFFFNAKKVQQCSHISKYNKKKIRNIDFSTLALTALFLLKLSERRFEGSSLKLESNYPEPKNVDHG